MTSEILSVKPVETVPKSLTAFYAVEIIMVLAYIKLKKVFKW